MKDRPKKSNPRARKPVSRHEKMECPYCGTKYNRPSLAAHVSLSHTKELEKEHQVASN